VYFGKSNCCSFFFCSAFSYKATEIKAAAGYKNDDDTLVPTNAEVLQRMWIVSPMGSQDVTLKEVSERGF
jgi:hypothetical protein